MGDLFNDKTVTGRLTSMAKKSIKGVENVYTQVVSRSYYHQMRCTGA